MSLLRQLVKELGQTQSIEWLATLLKCHDEALEDNRLHKLPDYPFFNFLAGNDFILTCEFLGETAKLHGIRCAEDIFITGTNQISMDDLGSLGNYIESMRDRVLFVETVPLTYLRSNC